MLYTIISHYEKEIIVRYRGTLAEAAQLWAERDGPMEVYEGYEKINFETEVK